MDRKEYLRQYRQTEEYKRKNAERMRKRNASPEGKEYAQEYRKSLKRRYNTAKRFNTKHRKTLDGLPDIKEWTISFQEYIDLLQRPCYYCNISLASDTGSGLDRIDNRKGYISGNVNPCCGHCNRIRADTMDSEEFRRQTKLNGRWHECSDSGEN